MAQRAPKRAGRTPGERGTRVAILAAARTHYAKRGYDATSVRAVARGERRAFPFEAGEVVERIVLGPRGQIGRRLALFFLSIWDDPERREHLMGMLRAATTSADAAELLREGLGERVLRPVGEHLGPDGPLRMSLCAAHLVGLGITRYIVDLEPLASLEPDAVADLVAPALQRYMTGALDL
jgi:Tetracyclin repressor-like, C-terminal domain